VKYVFEGNIAKNKKSLITAALAHVIHFLKLPEEVFVYVVPSPRGTFGKAGHCMQMSKRKYELEINTMISASEMVRTIFHEMKHVEQYATARMTQKSWENDSMTAFRDVEYKKLPWEKEAYEFEERIYRLFKKKHNIQ